jgi:hypothetical protein
MRADSLFEFRMIMMHDGHMMMNDMKMENAMMMSDEMMKK